MYEMYAEEKRKKTKLVYIQETSDISIDEGLN